MKNLYTIALMLLAFVPVLVSCDDESGVVTPPTPEEVLTRTWKVVEVEVKEEGEVIADDPIYNTFTIRFAEDGTYFVNVTTDGFPVADGTWRWADPNVKRNIILDSGEIEVLLLIATLEADRLVFTFEREGGIVESGRAMVIPDRQYYFVLDAI